MPDWLYILKYGLDVIDTHFHRETRWLGARAGWDGTNEVNSASNNSLSPFILTCGNDTWGAPLCIIGSGDTPVIPGRVYFDPHRISVQAATDDAPTRMRMAWGASYAAGIAANTFTEVSIVAATKLLSGPYEAMFPRLPVGTKVFAAIWMMGANNKLISFTIGLHEYSK